MQNQLLHTFTAVRIRMHGVKSVLMVVYFNSASFPRKFSTHTNTEAGIFNTFSLMEKKT